jgi:hypothetical protein
MKILPEIDLFSQPNKSKGNRPKRAIQILKCTTREGDCRKISIKIRVYMRQNSKVNQVTMKSMTEANGEVKFR